MRKLNYKNLTLFIVMIIFAMLFLRDWLLVLMGASFTWFGLITNMLLIFIVNIIYDYFKEYLKSIEGKK